MKPIFKRLSYLMSPIISVSSTISPIKTKFLNPGSSYSLIFEHLFIEVTYGFQNPIKLSFSSNIPKLDIIDSVFLVSLIESLFLSSSNYFTTSSIRFPTPADTITTLNCQNLISWKNPLNPCQMYRSAESSIF